MRAVSVKERLALGLALAGVAPLIAFGAWSFFTLQRSERASVVATNARVARLTAGNVRWNLGDDIAVLKALSADIATLDHASALTPLLVRYATLFPEYYVLGVVDESGAVLGEWHDAQFHVPNKPADGNTIEGVTVALAHGTGSGAGTPAVVMSTSIPRADARLRLVACLRLNQVERDVRNAGAVLVDAESHIILPGGRQRPAMTGIGWYLPPANAAADASDTSAGEYVDESGTRQLAVATAVPQLDWRVIVLQPMSEAMAPAVQLANRLALAIVFALALTATSGVLLSRRFIRSARALQQATLDLASGHFETRAPVDSEDLPEFIQLATAFNSMAARLDALQQDVKRQERQLIFGRVVAGLFHDLAHPIQNIENNIRLLMRDDLDAEGRRSVRNTIDREFTALRRFMDDVLDVARPAPIERSEVDLNACVVEVVDAMRAEAERAQVSLAPRTEGSALYVDGESFALSRVLRNLIANAIQASSPGQSVIITTRRVDGSAEIGVADHGIGIAPDRLHAIFDDFTTTKRRGLGLGLATSKRIIEQMAGSIWVESEIGRGSTFTVRLEACQAPRVEAVG